ncbi:hypothetical protein GCM10019059_36480 [Camelimonas fluminis]|uniref:Uncharacterized protein n=1 Tax=Camelimonas fluminis TaxID=1576911 RepID=A0ABV7UCM6_9HYPH|nr:hypothetical protein [Camelimonas fluminis]GHE73627.1 hypothetical protein GCM10019059_36480 [Camelimonas fluminis]
MSSRRELALEYVKRVKRWISERDQCGDYREYQRSGKVNRGALCAELDFSRSVINQNPAVKAALISAEQRWFAGDQQNTQAHEAALERSEKRVAQHASDISRLEDQIAKLKAENTFLRKQLERYAAMDAVIQQTGVAPRLC